MANGFKLHITICDESNNMLEDFWTVHPANTIERSAMQVRDSLEKVYGTADTKEDLEFEEDAAEEGSAEHFNRHIAGDR